MSISRWRSSNKPNQDPWKARHTSIRIALPSVDMGASRQIPRIGLSQQPREGIETHRIEGLHHSCYFLSLSTVRKAATWVRQMAIARLG